MNSMTRIALALASVAMVAFFLYSCKLAYKIREISFMQYGNIIHEFDPWFNFRASEYLLENGSAKFFKWFDHEAWYPLGRPVGTTIYPGMQFAAVWIHNLLQMIPTYQWVPSDTLKFIFPFLMDAYNFGPMTLNDICVFIPVWGGVVSSIAQFFLCKECTGSNTVGVLGAFFMAVIPAGLMRSMAGSFDNECVAVPAMMVTFALWARAVRHDEEDARYPSWLWAIPTGFAYWFMVSSWGGYVFMSNLIAIHAFILWPLGHFTDNNYKAYSIFYILGSVLSATIPVVGWVHFKSMELIAPLLVFLGYQYLKVMYTLKEKNRWSTPRFYSILYGCAVVGLAVIAILTFVFDMGGLSVRVRSLFLKHTHTGNPLVDSVAEHQPANQGILNHYLQDGIFLAPIGLVYLCNRLNASNYFLITYAVVTYYFCLKMMRLVLLMGGCVSALSAVAVGFTLEWFAVEAAKLFLGHEDEDDEIERIEMEAIAAAKDKKKDDKDKAKTTVPQLAGDAKDAKGKRRASGSSSASTPLSRRERRRSSVDSQTITQLAMEHNKLPKPIKKLLDQWREVPKASRTTLTVAVLAVVMAVFGQKSYNIYNASTQIAPSTSMPQIVFFDHQKGRMVDDYYRSYIWLRDNTPKDSRVLAWWDYGYQINGIAKRTSLADGNTWNHDHIAFVGRCLMSPEKRAHNIIRHVADYVLIWANGNGDDLQKSMHISRITNSVFPDLCKGDKFCNNFGFNQHGPMEDMAKSLVYKLHQNGKNPAVKVHPKLFKEVYESPNGLVRIYKVQNVAEDSKEWIASPESRVCDGGGWYCPGHYPPALGKLFDQKFAGYDHDARKVTNQ